MTVPSLNWAPSMKQMFIFVEIYYSVHIASSAGKNRTFWNENRADFNVFFLFLCWARYLAVVQVHPILYNLFPFALKIIIAVLLQPPPFPLGSHVLYVVKYPQQQKNPSNRHITSVFLLFHHCHTSSSEDWRETPIKNVALNLSN